MDDEDSQSALAKKRTARVQLANGAMEARAYVAPTPVPLDTDHKTIEMRTVAVDEALDPRRRATVARGMGEAVATLEGDVVDPTTGRVIPAVDPRAVPDTPWAHGKRPTQLRGSAPARIGSAGAGAATASPGYGAYIAAGAIVVAAIVCAGLILMTRGNTKPAGDAASANVGAAAAPTPPNTGRALEPKPSEPPNVVLPPVAPPASAPAVVDSTPPPAVAPPSRAPGLLPPGKAPPPPTPSAAKSSGRIF